MLAGNTVYITFVQETILSDWRGNGYWETIPDLNGLDRLDYYWLMLRDKPFGNGDETKDSRFVGPIHEDDSEQVLRMVTETLQAVGKRVITAMECQRCPDCKWHGCDCSTVEACDKHKA